MLAVLGHVGRILEGEAYIGERVGLLERAERAEVVVTGSSVAQHIEPAAMCLEGVNLYEPRSDLFEVLALARHLEARKALPRFWVVGFVPGFTTQDKGAKAAGGSDRRILVYRTLQAAGYYGLIGDDWQGAVQAVAAPVLGYKEWKPRLRSGMSGKPFRQRPPVSDVPVRDSEAATREARAWIDMLRAEQDRVRFHDDTIPQRARSALLELQRLLSDNGSRLLLVEMPVTSELKALGYGLTGAEYRLERAFLAEVEQEGATLVRADEYGAQPRRRFRDFLHLRRSEGAVFTRELAGILAERGVMKKPACTGVQAGF